MNLPFPRLRVIIAVFALHVGGIVPAWAGPYRIEVAAQSGKDGLTNIENDISINQKGNVVFIGHDASGARSIWMADGTGAAARSINSGFAGSGRDFSFPQINDFDDIVAQDRLNNTSSIRTWKASDGSWITLADSYLNGGIQVLLPSISNAGAVSYVEPISGGVVKTSISSFLFPVGLGSRPMIAGSGSGRIVARSGDAATDAIKVYSTTVTVAPGSPAFFDRLGKLPGISDNGKVIAFFGSLKASASTISPVAGPGIFIAVNNTSNSWSVYRVAGFAGEVGTDASQTSVGFAAFSEDHRVGVISEKDATGVTTNAVVCFMARPAAAGRDGDLEFSNTFGLWSVNIDFDPTGRPFPGPYSPIKVVQLGDLIDGLGTIDAINLHDPISDKLDASAHFIALRAAAGPASAVIRATSQRSKITLHGPSTEALQNADESAGADIRLVPVPDFLKLWRAPEVDKGLIADGVTPLLIQISDAKNCFIKFEAPTGGSIEGNTLQGGQILRDVPYLMDRLFVLKNGKWEASPSGELFADVGTETAFAYIAAIPSDDLQMEAGWKEIKVQFRVQRDDQDIDQTDISFSKPPVVLIHGYNTEGKWGPGFLEKVGMQRGLFKEVIYGVDPVTGDFRENSYASLPVLEKKLHKILKEEVEQPSGWHSDWAFTRYDVIAHSQGGVLTRMLCSKGDKRLAAPFRSADNFYRGRFHRVVTIGSPHNGSRIARYLFGLLSRDDFQLTQILPTVMFSNYIPGSIRPLVLNGRILQPKFDPFGFQIRELNKPNGRWTPDENAKFHLVSTPIQYPATKSSACLLFRFAGLFGPVSTHVQPLGSDGVTDAASARVGELGSENISAMEQLVPNIRISHAPVPLNGFGTQEYQTASNVVAAWVMGLLNSYADDGVSFASFAPPARLNDDIKQGIDGAAGAVSTKVDDLVTVNSFPGFNRALAAASPIAVASNSFGVSLTPSPGSPIDGDVNWMIEVFGPGGVTDAGVSVTVEADSRSATVMLEDTVLGDVVMYANYTSTTGELVFAKPVKLASIPPAGATLASLELRLPPITPIGGAIVPEVWGVYSDGSKHLLFIGVGEATLTSGDASIVEVTDAGEFLLKAEGSTNIGISYRGLSVSVPITPVSPLPAIVSPAAAQGLVGQPFNYQIDAGDDVLSWDATGLPLGLTLDPYSGQIVGIPSVIGDSSVTLSATNAAGTSTKPLALSIVPVPTLHSDTKCRSQWEHQPEHSPDSKRRRKRRIYGNPALRLRCGPMADQRQCRAIWRDHRHGEQRHGEYNSAGDFQGRGGARRNPRAGSLSRLQWKRRQADGTRWENFHHRGCHVRLDYSFLSSPSKQSRSVFPYRALAGDQ